MAGANKDDKKREGPRTSRVGKRPVALPKGVDASITTTSISVKGPRGTLSFTLPGNVAVKKVESELRVTSDAEGSNAARLQGLARAIVANMVTGVTEGYKKELQLVGTGYRAELKGQDLVCTLGFSHQKVFKLPSGIKIDIPKDSKGQRIVIEGSDKVVVGQSAATIRGFRPPQPYGGKGVRYKGEHVREKAGKAGKT